MRPENPSLDLAKFEELDKKQKLIHLIRFALLAPSSHNTQPWLFKVAGEDKIEVFGDPDRALKYSDPTNRQFYTSIGAAIQNLMVAAEYFGYDPELKIDGDTHNLSVAIITLSRLSGKQGQHQALARAIFTRHTNRFPYERKELNHELLEQLAALGDADVQISLISEQHQREQVTKVIGDATEWALDDYEFRQELAGWLRSGTGRHKDGMTGDNLGLPLPLSFIFPVIMRHAKMGKVQRRMEERALKATPVFGIISTAADSKFYWVKSGMAFEKIALTAEVHGLKVGVNAAAIETKEFHKDLKKIINSNTRPQVFFRLGYCAKIPKPAPRLNVEDVLR